jgi:hypothetical protein
MSDSRVISPADDPASVAGEKVQGSPGVLKPTKAPVETIEEIPVQEIKSFRGIPDFREPTISAYPAVVKAYDQYLCIDGFELVEKTASGGVARIRCRIFHLDHPDEIETALLKAAIRMMPAGGTCLYSEIVRSTRGLFTMLMGSPEPPTVFSHGGARRGVAYTENKEDNIRVLLAERLGKSKTTINKYLSYSEWLNDEALAVLIEKLMEKDFFEKAQVKKRILVKNLKSAGRPDAEVVAAVSERIVSWATDYQEGRSFSDPEAAEVTEVPAPEHRPAEGAPAPALLQQTFDHWDGRDDATAPPTIETIRRDLQAVQVAVDSAPVDEAQLLVWAIDWVPHGICALANLRQVAIHLQRAAGTGEEA